MSFKVVCITDSKILLTTSDEKTAKAAVVKHRNLTGHEVSFYEVDQSFSKQKRVIEGTDITRAEMQEDLSRGVFIFKDSIRIKVRKIVSENLD